MVGLPTAVPLAVGVEIVPCGVKFTVELVPVGVTVCVCPDSAEPVKVGVLTVPLGVPPLVPPLVAFWEDVDTVMPPTVVAAAVPELLVVILVPVTATVCVCVPNALPVKVGVLMVPEGVPAPTLDVVSCDPVNV
jgi:hypothetical protein